MVVVVVVVVVVAVGPDGRPLRRCVDATVSIAEIMAYKIPARFRLCQETLRQLVVSAIGQGHWLAILSVDAPIG